MDTATKTPLRRLFTHADRYTDDAHALDSKVTQALRPIVDAWVAKGFSIRDIQFVMTGAVQDACIDSILRGDVDRESQRLQVPNPADLTAVADAVATQPE